MSWLSGIFSNNKVMKLVDKAFYTKQEKAEQHTLALKLYEPFKVAQRYLALLFCTPCVLFISTGLVFICIDKIERGQMIIDMTYNSLGTPSIIILTFYFGGGVAEGIIRNMKKKEEK